MTHGASFRWCVPITGLLLSVCLASCAPPAPQTGSAARVHAVVGQAYGSGGVWFYPAESYAAVQTGLAVVYPPGHRAATADGEDYDPTSLTAAHQTLQLPAVIRLTNLESGLSVDVRLNDRGPESPGRLIQVTPRTAELLAFPAGRPARVRIAVLEAESRAVIEQAGGSPTPKLTVQAAPTTRVSAADLPPPPGSTASARAHAISPAPSSAARDAEPESLDVPRRMPETATREAPAPGELLIRLDRFTSRASAARQAARVSGLGPTIDARREGRETSYLVRLGPYDSVSQADAALDRAINAGVTDARIVVE